MKLDPFIEIIRMEKSKCGEKGKRDRVAYWMAGVSLTAGFTLLFLGFFFCPRGEIHSSVVYTFGEILVFVGSLMGISIHYGSHRAEENKNKNDSHEKDR